jgi:zinc/manganese transport system substrate-binding protein/manganese/iron transport system substrate-binding protein
MLRAEADRERRFYGGRRAVRRSSAAFVVVLSLVLGAGCGAGGSSGGKEAGSGEKLQVAVTISVLQDLAEQVGGDRVEASSIVPVGGSPETFQPSPRDAGRISEARVVFENGLGLDDWVEDLVESAGNEEQTVVELAEGLETLEDGEHGEEQEAEREHGGEDEHEHAEGNPHLWLDVANAEHYVEKIQDTLVELDPDGAEGYEANGAEYLAKLEELDGYIKEKAEGIPEERRKLVTFHDAFPYFAEAYGFELVGVVLENPEAEPGSREVAGVVRTIEEEEVPVVFTEPQFNTGLANTIAQEARVEVRELYTDTLIEDGAANTYDAMMRTNIDRISEDLG